MGKIVLTGAAGRLGSYLREPLLKISGGNLVSMDIKDDIGELLPGETYVRADLANYDEVAALMDGVETVVHFGAIVDDGPFMELLGPNFVGSYNVWESAFQAGAKRIVYASSVHAIGMYPIHQTIDTEVPKRPDSFYGLAKCFTEDLGRLFYEKRGLESVHLRIYSCTSVNSRRSLWAWLSYDDLVHLVERAVLTPTVGFAVVYGVSNNDRTSLDNSKARFLGYKPKDNAETYAEEMEAKEPPHDPNDLAATRIGGPFASGELGVSAMVNLKTDADGKS
ncbi:MAG: NAD(P)-dependent oxidoreductase [Alphaproteobacteria bacterium]